MKIMLFNKEAYNANINPSLPCRKCKLKGTEICSKISATFCVNYGGFQPSDSKIFTL